MLKIWNYNSGHDASRLHVRFHLTAHNYTGIVLSSHSMRSAFFRQITVSVQNYTLGIKYSMLDLICVVNAIFAI